VGDRTVWSIVYKGMARDKGPGCKKLFGGQREAMFHLCKKWYGKGTAVRIPTGAQRLWEARRQLNHQSQQTPELGVTPKRDSGAIDQAADIGVNVPF